MLHALVEQIMLHKPCLATFTQELAEFETVPGGKQDLIKLLEKDGVVLEVKLSVFCSASIKGLTAEIDGEFITLLLPVC